MGFPLQNNPKNLDPSYNRRIRYLIGICITASMLAYHVHVHSGGGRMVRWCWLNFQCRGGLLILKE